MLYSNALLFDQRKQSNWSTIFSLLEAARAGYRRWAGGRSVFQDVPCHCLPWSSHNISQRASMQAAFEYTRHTVRQTGLPPALASVTLMGSSVRWPTSTILRDYAQCYSAELFFFSAEHFSALPSISISSMLGGFFLLCQAFVFHAVQYTA